MERSKQAAEMDRYEILDALLEDGYELASSGDAAEVSKRLQHAARTNCLVWTKEHIKTTLVCGVESRGRFLVLT